LQCRSDSDEVDFQVGIKQVIGRKTYKLIVERYNRYLLHFQLSGSLYNYITQHMLNRYTASLIRKNRYIGTNLQLILLLLLLLLSLSLLYCPVESHTTVYCIRKLHELYNSNKYVNQPSALGDSWQTEWNNYNNNYFSYFMGFLNTAPMISITRMTIIINIIY